MFFVYLLFSPSSGKTYTGYTNDVERRVTEHNLTEVTGFTLRYRPWVLIYLESFENKKDAMRRERFLKSGQGRSFIKQIVTRYRNGERFLPSV